MCRTEDIEVVDSQNMAMFKRLIVRICGGRTELEADIPLGKAEPLTPKAPERVLDAYPPEMMATLEERYFCSEKAIGEGQWGVVREAMNKTSGEIVAVKSISKKHALKHLSMKQLRLEVDILRSLEHSSIAQFLGAFEDQSNVYVTMEMLRGGELFDALAEKKRFDEKNTAIIMRQALASIAYLHGKSICHRDIKAENFLFTQPLAAPIESNTLKLIDFSYARRFEHGERMNTFCGSPDYIAPEVTKKDYDESCDVWSVGVLMYALLSGYMPFRGDDDVEVVKLIRQGQYDFSLKEWDIVSWTAKAVVKGLMNVDSEKRWTADTTLKHYWFTEVTTASSFLWTPRKFQISARICRERPIPLLGSMWSGQQTPRNQPIESIAMNASCAESKSPSTNTSISTSASTRS